MASFTSPIGHYDDDKEDIENYLARLQSWCIVNDVTNTKKKHVLLAEIGPKAFQVLNNLCFPDAPDSKEFKALTDMLKAHYVSKITPMTSRLKLQGRKQEANETISSYIVALKQIAVHCNFGNSLDERLRDAFTCGVRSPKILKRLIEASQKEDYSWQIATTLALSIEAVDKDTSSELFQTQSHTPKVHSVRDGNSRQSARRGNRNSGRGRPRNSQRQPNASGQRQPSTNSQAQRQPNANSQRQDTQGERCFRCGSFSHVPNNCPFKNKQCFKCHRYGHTQSQCGRRQPGAVHYVDETVDDTFDDASADLSNAFQQLFHVSEAHVQPTDLELPSEYTEELSVNGLPVTFTIDTACPVTVIPERMYQDHFSAYPLQPTQLQLSSYSKHGVPVLGQFLATVKYNHNTYSLPVFVTRGDNVALCGRQWLHAIRLDWRRICSIQGQYRNVEQLLEQYKDVFSESPGAIKDFKAEVTVQPGAKPLFYRPRPVPYALKDAVAEKLHDLEKKGIISKIDRNDWAAPIVVVPKADKSLRICGDYKVTVNRAVESEVYPLPTAEDLFATLSGGQVFTKLDLSNAYQQLELTPESQKYLVINTHLGLYKFHRLAYGVSTAPNIFQKVMDQILQGISGVTCYLDDILIATDRASHLSQVAKVLERLRSYGVHVKREKCSFMTSSVTYLGHTVNAKGIQPTAEKVQAIRDMRAPKDLHELRVLLGMVNYYGKFLPDLATLLSPWYNLLTKEAKFCWSDACAKALTKIKELLTSEKLLVHFDPKKKIVLACDASPVGLGCVLSHIDNGVEKPIAFASRSLTSAERNYCQLEREGLAIIYGLTKFHKYVYGRHIIIETDNKPVTRILSDKTGLPSLAALRLQRWALILMAHDYELRYRKAQDHGNCDCLSRLPGGTDNYLATELPVNYFSLVDELPITAKQVAEQSRKDPVISAAMDYTSTGWCHKCPSDDLRPYFNRREQLSTDKGCLLWGTRVIIPPKFQQKLLNELHTTHPGVVRMKSMARAYIWFPNMDSQIEELVKGCSTCQAMQKSAPVVPLSPWQYPLRCWERIHIDFAELDRTQYLVLIDSYSKWLEVKQMRTSTSQQTIKELRQIFASYGLPQVLVSDNGPQLVSLDFENFLKSNGIQHIMSAPYHPASNGAAERSVQTVKLALKKYLLSKGSSSNLDCALQNFLFAYRNTPQATTGRSPAELFLKRSLRTRFSLLKPDVTSDVHSKHQQQRQNHDASRPSAIPEFSVGETVRVKSTPQYPGVENYVKGVVVRKDGPYHYLVKIGNRCRMVHLDHLRKTGELESVCVAPDLDVPDPIVPFVPDVSAPVVKPPSVPDVSNPVVHPIAPSVSMPNNASGSVPEPNASHVPIGVVPTATPAVEARRSQRAPKRPQRLIETI